MLNPMLLDLVGVLAIHTITVGSRTHPETTRRDERDVVNAGLSLYLYQPLFQHLNAQLQVLVVVLSIQTIMVRAQAHREAKRPGDRDVANAGMTLQ
jgi:hypothetical protein